MIKRIPIFMDEILIAMKHLHLSLLIVFFGMTTEVNSQISATDTVPILTLVNNIFNTGTFVEVSNIMFNGVAVDDTTTNVQIGLFANGFSESLPIDSGFAMTTGSMFDALTGEFTGVSITDEYEDTDIESISEFPVNDCAVLEFDVFNTADALAFNFSFGSMEYEFFTCSAFNDAFGLFISGPGISGTFENEAINIATIPNSDIPIAINTVNSGVSSSGFDDECELANPNWVEDSQYFISNYSGSLSSVLFTGFTVNLEAFVEVEQNETYHLKFAICDVADGALDSGIMLEANSFEGRFLNATSDNRPEKLGVYPNPSSGNVFVSIPPEYSGQILNLRLLDVQGRAVKSMTISGVNRTEIFTGELEKGFYLIELAANGEVVGTAKLIKE